MTRRHNWRRPKSRGMTLLELMVALILSVLVMGMLLPMLSSLMRPDVPPDVALPADAPPWARAVAADVREIVSPTKCAIPVVQVVPPNEIDPMPQLIVQSLCRIPEDPAHVPARGPNEVRYRLEAVSTHGPYALVRVAHGWHDPYAARVILAENLTGWSIEPVAAPSATGEADSRASTGRVAPVPLPIALHVRLTMLENQSAARFAVPQVESSAHVITTETGHLQIR